ncbi:hypothetical protein RhiirA4_489789, partial [Rhizophagus irregularis]
KDGLLDLGFSKIRFLAPQSRVIYDKRSLDSLEVEYTHSLELEYMISGFLLKWSVQYFIFRLRRTGL